MIACHVPVANWMFQRLFENQLTSTLPDLKQELFILLYITLLLRLITEVPNLRVFDFEEYSAEVTVTRVQTG